MVCKRRHPVGEKGIQGCGPERALLFLFGEGVGVRNVCAARPPHTREGELEESGAGLTAPRWNHM